MDLLALCHGRGWAAEGREQGKWCTPDRRAQRTKELARTSDLKKSLNVADMLSLRST